jgi:HPt (histidine-containing phosphotransfer) domain-containing protein
MRLQKPSPSDRKANRFRQIDGIDVDTALRLLNNDEDFLERLLNLFSTEHGDDPDKLRDALRQNDETHLRHLVHTLKGTAGNLAMPLVFKAALAAEDTLHDRTRGSLALAVEQLSAALESILHALKQLQPRTETATKEDHSIRPEVAALKVNGLTARLEEHDTEALSFYKEHLDLFRTLFAKEHAAIMAHIEAFDFDAALSVIRQSAAYQAIPALRKGA